MSDSTKAMFFDLDRATGQFVPTTYESMRGGMLRWHPIFEHVPDDIRRLLLTAIDYFALAYEQANVGRGHLYERLTNDAFVKAILALELTLKQRLRPQGKVPLKMLISEGIAAGLLPTTDRYELLWTELRENRNAITHDDPNQSTYGPSTGGWIGLVINAVNAIYANAMIEPIAGDIASSGQRHNDISKTGNQ